MKEKVTYFWSSEKENLYFGCWWIEFCAWEEFCFLFESLPCISKCLDEYNIHFQFHATFFQNELMPLKIIIKRKAKKARIEKRKYEVYLLAGATERFLSGGVPINKKSFLKFFLLHKSLILGGVRPHQTPPGPRPLLTCMSWKRVASYTFIFFKTLATPIAQIKVYIFIKEDKS